MLNRIGFIGAGAVGKALGQFFTTLNLEVTGYYSLFYEDALNASKAIDVQAFETLSDVIHNSNCIAITVNDDAIIKVVEEIISKDVLLKNKFIFHTSGAHSAHILSELATRGATTASIHPLQSFPRDVDYTHHFNDIYFTLEGEGLDETESALNQLGIKTLRISSKNKTAYHMAAVIASNFLVPLMDQAIEVFSTIGIEKQDGFRALLPLIQGTLNNIEVNGTNQALTGPFARGDLSTVERHLKQCKTEDVKKFYLENGKRAIKHVEKYKHLKPEHELIMRLLKEYEQ